MLGVVGPLGENLDFLIRWDLTLKQFLITKPPKIKLYSVKAIKRYLNEKNLIHGQVMATISVFNPPIFEKYFSLRPNAGIPIISKSILNKVMCMWKEDFDGECLVLISLQFKIFSLTYVTLAGLNF